MSTNPPQLPSLYDTTYVSPSGPVVNVPVGGNLQAAINNALPDSTITLDPAGVYVGNFTLPVKSGAGYIHIRSSNPLIPSPGHRVTAADFAAMPKLAGTGTGGRAIGATPSAHHYRLIGLEVYPNIASTAGVIQFGTGAENNASLFPQHMIVDRCYVRGRAGLDSRRGVMFSGNYQAVIDSHVSDWKVIGQDAQAIAAWTGNGPFKVHNNYLEGAGENVMFGGVDTLVSNLTPSDIEIRGNSFFKPLSWKVGDPSYAGKNWTIKNLLELKHASRALVTDNTFENCWVHAQTGNAIVFTPTNQSGSNPWVKVSDVTFTGNKVKNTTEGMRLAGQVSQRMLIRNNQFSGIASHLFYVLSGMEDLEIDHNTAIQAGAIISASGSPSLRFKFTNNIMPHNSYGIIGTNFSIGNSSINHYFPGADIRKNVIILPQPNAKEVTPAYYPPDNFFPQNIAAIGFENYPTDLQLKTTSTFYNAGTDGKSPGILPAGGLMPKDLAVSNVGFGNVGGGTYKVKVALVDAAEAVVATSESADVVVPADPAPTPTATIPTVTVG